MDQRARAVLWARGILADPNVALVGMTWDREVHGFRFRVETLQGQVLAERLLPRIAGRSRLGVDRDDMPSWAHDETDHLSWSERRLIQAPLANPIQAYREICREAGTFFVRCGPEVSDGDDLAAQYRHFLAQPDLQRANEGPGVDWRKSPRTTGSVLDALRDVIREMAQADLSDDEIRRAKRRPRTPPLSGYAERVRPSRQRQGLACPPELGMRLYASGATLFPNGGVG
ncbi:hypothetical protein AB0F91_45560 [Amycolatopsis sp. NPDC023774]|uniref:hypothetical protein n=1 Tax=Amycolatopsis sp. NPDC023774 TaxID=3155015 RepID=UPI0033CCB413